MIDSERKTFGEIMAAFCTTFDKPVSDPLLEIYFSALKSLTLDEFKTAANKLLLSARFFPKPVDFLELARGSEDDRAQKAWLLLVEAVGRIGWPRSLYVDDLAIAFALEQTFGGWIECNEQLGPLCPADPMFASLRKTFQQNFLLALNDNQLPRKQQQYFPSLCEAQNRQNIAQWTGRKWPQLEDGTPYFTQRVGVIRGGEVSEIEATYSAETAQLTEGARRLLQSGVKEQRQLVAAN